MSKELPTELLYVQDLISRLPKDRKRILEHEIHSRERESLQCHALRRVMRTQAWASIQRAIIISIAVFILLAAIGQLVGLAKWVQDVRDYSVNLPSPIGKGIELSANEFIPQSAVVDLAAQLPQYGVLESAVISVIVLVVLVAYRAYTGYFLFRQSRKLREVANDLEEEIRILRAWQKISVDGSEEIA